MNYFIGMVPMLRSQHETNCQMPLSTHSNILTSQWEPNSLLKWILHWYQVDVCENKTTLRKRHSLGIRRDYPVFPATSSDTLQAKEPKGTLLVTVWYFKLLPKKRTCKAGVSQYKPFNCKPKTTTQATLGELKPSPRGSGSYIEHAG